MQNLNRFIWSGTQHYCVLEIVLIRVLFIDIRLFKFEYLYISYSCFALGIKAFFIHMDRRILIEDELVFYVQCMAIETC